MSTICTINGHNVRLAIGEPERADPDLDIWGFFDCIVRIDGGPPLCFGGGWVHSDGSVDPYEGIDNGDVWEVGAELGIPLVDDNGVIITDALAELLAALRLPQRFDLPPETDRGDGNC